MPLYDIPVDDNLSFEDVFNTMDSSVDYKKDLGAILSMINVLLKCVWILISNREPSFTYFKQNWISKWNVDCKYSMKVETFHFWIMVAWNDYEQWSWIYGNGMRDQRWCQVMTEIQLVLFMIGYDREH